MNNPEPIEIGRQAEIYLCGENLLLKHYKSGYSGLGLNEAHWLEAMFKVGFNVPKSFGLEERNGSAALKMEHLRGPCLEELLWTEDGAGSEVGTQLGQLHARLHSIEIADSLMKNHPSCHRAESIFSNGLRVLVHWAGLHDLKNLLAQYGHGDAPCHGDFHPSNVIKTTARLVVIDWCDSYLGPAESDIGTSIVRFRTAMIPCRATDEEAARFRNNLKLLESAYLAAYQNTGRLDCTSVVAWVRLAAAHTMARKGGSKDVLDKLVAGQFALNW
jgi:tRNA A-37 threonylcarbamoyl transferase component Bud32